MPLMLTCSEECRRVGLLEDRLYVIRTLVPPGFEAYFREKASYISAHTSTAIEGNRLDEQQALLILVEGPDEADPEEVELTNLQEAYGLIDQLVGDRSVRIDHGLIRTMNSIILKGLPGWQARNRGKYRSGPALIVDSQTREIRYRPPAPGFVSELMDGLVADIQRWMRDGEYPPPTIAALAHFGLISIHPFEDGNGRTARLLADAILTLTDWAADGMLSVSESIWKRRQQYYDVLRETQGDSFDQEIDVSPFVLFHQRMLDDAAASLERSVVRFNKAKDEFVAVVSPALNPRQVLSLMSMLDLSPLSTSRYARLTGTSQSSAFSDLTEMMGQGLVERRGKGKNTRYHVSDKLRRKIESMEAAEDEAATTA